MKTRVGVLSSGVLFFSMCDNYCENSNSKCENSKIKILQDVKIHSDGTIKYLNHPDSSSILQSLLVQSPNPDATKQNLELDLNEFLVFDGDQNLECHQNLKVENVIDNSEQTIDVSLSDLLDVELIAACDSVETNSDLQLESNSQTHNGNLQSPTEQKSEILLRLENLKETRKSLSHRRAKSFREISETRQKIIRLQKSVCDYDDKIFNLDETIKTILEQLDNN